MNAPTEPFDGFLREGRDGFVPRDGEEVPLTGDAPECEFSDATAAVESSAAVAFKRPAQPSWLSTALGS